MAITLIAQAANINTTGCDLDSIINGASQPNMDRLAGLAAVLILLTFIFQQ